MTTKELAEIIGVSRTTLSKVMNKQEGVSPKTIKRIEEKIKKYNFVPNTSARNLIGKKNKIIGLFIKQFSIDLKDSESEIDSHFFSEFINKAIIEAQNRDYQVLINIIKSGQTCLEVEKTFKSGLISGAAMLGFDQDEKNWKQFLKTKNKIILMNQFDSTPSEYIKHVNINDEDSAYHAMNVLFKNNHRNILYIDVDIEKLAVLKRRKGVFKFYEEHKEKMGKLDVIKGDFTRKSGYESVNKFLKKNTELPSAIFAANDFMAIGAIDALKEKNIKVPEEVSIIGFDGIEISKYMVPSLSTMKIDFRKVAQVVVNTLIDYIEDKEVEDLQLIDALYIQRETVKNQR